MKGFNKKVIYGQSDLLINQSNVGEYLHIGVKRMVNNGEPIPMEQPYISTPAKDGVISLYDIRTDIFDEALDALTSVHRTDANRYAETLKNVNENLTGVVS